MDNIRIPAANNDEGLLLFLKIPVKRNDLFNGVMKYGGYKEVVRKRKWTAVRKHLQLPNNTSGETRTH